MLRKFAIAAAVTSLATSIPVTAQPRPYLELEAAQNGAASCLEFARAEGLTVAIAVTDRGGELVHFVRMDDVYTRQQAFARLKAESAATTPVSTAQLGTAAYADDSPLRGVELLDGVTTVEGGVPIRLASSYHLGGVGVSGASPAQDGQCAQIVADVIATELSD